jgi:hypothetical protein
MRGYRQEAADTHIKPQGFSQLRGIDRSFTDDLQMAKSGFMKIQRVRAFLPKN